jgi:hypothetical protein
MVPVVVLNLLPLTCRKQKALAVTHYVANIIEHLDSQIKELVDKLSCFFIAKSARGIDLNKRLIFFYFPFTFTKFQNS